MNALRFWRHVRKTAGCWMWEGNLNELGYGRVRVKGRLWAAHRIAYELEVGPIPPGSWVRQTCHERACVRPDHLSLFPVARLRPEDVEAIKRSFLGSVRLASRYGVSDRHIRRIRV